MAIVVESTASNTSASVTTFTLTKPTGLSVGDLMVATFSIFDGTNDTIATLSGWTLVQDQIITNGRVNAQYKIADSGDVAASNFTWSLSGTTQQISGGIMRITGYNSLAPILYSDEDVNNTAASAAISFTTSITPNTDGSLVVLVFAANDGDGATTVSGYSATGSGVTFTELYDGGVDAGTSDPALAGAYGVQPSVAAITAYGATIASTKDNHGGIFMLVEAATDATGTNTLVTTTSEAFGQAGTADTVGTNVLAEATGESFAQSGRGQAPTQWTNEAKPSTTWVNEEL